MDQIDPSILYPDVTFVPENLTVPDRVEDPGIDRMTLLELAQASIPTSLGRSRLRLLGAYRQFHGHYALGDRAAAAQTLVEILTSGLAPRQFYLVLLFDAVPLLEGSSCPSIHALRFFMTPPDREMYFSERDTYHLMANLEEVFGPVSVLGRDSSHVLSPLGRMLYRTEPDATANTGTELSRSQLQAKAAMKMVHMIRQALARYLAKCCLLKGR